MLQDILENKSSTDAVCTTVMVGLPEGVIHGKLRGIFLFGDRDLHGAASVEAGVQVHAGLIPLAFPQSAFVSIADADQQILSPAVFQAKDILVFGEGVGDEVTCDGEA